MIFPDYAKMGSTVLRHTGTGTYYKDAGAWELVAGEVDGQLVVTKDPTGHMAHCIGEILTSATEKEWEANNKGHTT